MPADDSTQFRPRHQLHGAKSTCHSYNDHPSPSPHVCAFVFGSLVAATVCHELKRPQVKRCPEPHGQSLFNVRERMRRCELPLQHASLTSLTRASGVTLRRKSFCCRHGECVENWRAPQATSLQHLPVTDAARCWRCVRERCASTAFCC